MWRFYEPQGFLRAFSHAHSKSFWHFVFFGTAIINHFIQHIYILFAIFKYVFHHYCDVADLADLGYIHHNQQANTAALD